MRVKLKTVNPANLKRAWAATAMKAAETLGKTVERDLADLLRPTLESPAFASATIETGHTVQRNGTALRIHAWATVKGSLIWEFQQFGTRAHIQTRTSPPIAERDKPKVIRKRLRLDKSQGRTGRYFVIPAGTRVRGVQAAGWYQAAGSEERRAIRDTTKRYRVVAVSVKSHYGA